MPAQRATQPSAQRQGFRNVNQVLLRDLGSETGESAENPQPAGDQDERRDRIKPMAEAHRPGVLEGGADVIRGAFLPNAQGNFDLSGLPCLGRSRLEAGGRTRSSGFIRRGTWSHWLRS